MKKTSSCAAALIVALSLSTPSFAWSFSKNALIKSTSNATRRGFLFEKLVSSVILIQTLDATPALSANLPESNGADLSKTGTVEKLVPIVSYRNSLEECKNLLLDGAGTSSGTSLSPALLNRILMLLKYLPTDEKSVKKIFDEFSDPVSYKQKYLNQNAFLVYYTKGYDGPNRDSIESGEMPRQTLQYGARNECWNALDDFLIELNFGIKDHSSTRSDILDPLNKTISSFDRYLSIASQDDLDIAQHASLLQ